MTTVTATPVSESADVAEEETGYTKLEQDHYQAIQVKNREVSTLERKAETKKEDHSLAKKKFEHAQSELRSLIQNGVDRQQTLPFEGDKKEAWREVDLDGLGIVGSLAEKLTEADLGTLGAIANYTAEHELTDIEGIGPAKAKEMQAILDKFWADDSEYCNDEDADKTEEEPADNQV